MNSIFFNIQSDIIEIQIIPFDILTTKEIFF